MDELNVNPVDAGQNGVVDHVEEVAVEVVAETPVVDERSQSADDNAKYAAARREAESKAKVIEEKLKKFEQLAEKTGAKDVDEFSSMLESQLQQQAEQRRIEELESLGIDPYSYEQMLNADPTVLEAREIVNRAKKEESWRNEQNQFLSYFTETMGRPFDGTTDVVSQDTLDMVASGVPLLTAYKACDENGALRKQLDDLKSKLTANETNIKNAETSTGSVLNQSPTDTNFVDFKTFEQNKGNSEWMKRNLDKILQSRPKWR